MYVLDNVAFICHPHTGSRSLREALTEHNAQPVSTHHEYDWKRLAECRAVVCVVRNPFDLLFTRYAKQCRPNKPDQITLFDWLTAKLGGSRADFEGYMLGGLFYGLRFATHVIRFENLQNELDQVCSQLKLPRLTLKHLGKNYLREDIQYRSVFGTQERRLAEEAYRPILQTLNYEF